MSDLRNVVRTIKSHRQTRGRRLHRPAAVPVRAVVQVDPFLLLDEMGPADYGPGEAVGAPDHPHRGFETVTYMLEGEFEHEDSAGHKGELASGRRAVDDRRSRHRPLRDALARDRDEGRRAHARLPDLGEPAREGQDDRSLATRKISARSLPTAETPDKLARVRVIAGEALGACAVIDTARRSSTRIGRSTPGAERRSSRARVVRCVGVLVRKRRDDFRNEHRGG